MSKITHHADGREMDPWTKMALRDVVEASITRGTDPYRVTPEQLAQKAVAWRSVVHPGQKQSDMEIYGYTEADVLAFFREWHEQAAPRSPEHLRRRAEHLESLNEVNRSELENQSGEFEPIERETIREHIRERNGEIMALRREADETEQRNWSERIERLRSEIDGNKKALRDSDDPTEVEAIHSENSELYDELHELERKLRDAQAA